MSKDLRGFYDNLISRALADGSFASRKGGSGRPDSTAWAVLALQAGREGGDLVEPARRYLCSVQGQDGRMPVHPDHPEAYWPTAPSVLAWLRAPGAKPCLDRAVEFLLTHTGVHWKRRPEDFVEHDTAIRGWPWIGGCHSWVEPTALGILALRLAGHQQHPRVEEAVRMLMNRQIARGGWNYGNTFVFGRQLLPMPEFTGLALVALQGLVARREIEPSLEYLRTCIPSSRSPLALSWALLGLGAWGESLPASDGLICGALARQKEVGAYDTEGLSLLLLASNARQGLSAFPPSMQARS
jgi:hypothetical protein